MNCRMLLSASLLGLLASGALPGTAWAHTMTIGYENAGPGSVTFWYGSWHSPENFQTPPDYTEGSLQLQGPGTNTTVPFDLLVTTKPGGLIDGVTNFYSNGTMLVGTDVDGDGPVGAWQGATFGGLTPGTYEFTYIPITDPTQEWEPKDSVILSNFLELTRGVLMGGTDAGVMATESAVTMTDAQATDLRQIVRGNSADRAEASANGGSMSSMTASSPGLSASDFSVWARVGGGVLNAKFGGDLDIDHWLGQGGVEVAMTENVAFGIGVGGGQTWANTSSGSLDGDAFFMQPYVAYSSGAFTAIASFIYTCTNYNDSTDAIDSGDRYAATASLAYDVSVVENTTVTPIAFLAGGTEDLDTSSGDESLDFFIGRAGVELSQDLELLNTGTMHLYTSVAGEYITTDEPGISSPALLTAYDSDRLGARVEVGVDFTIAGTDTQFLGSAYGSGIGSDVTGFGGQVGLKIPF